VSVEQQIADLEQLVETDGEIKELTEKIGLERNSIDHIRAEVLQLQGRLEEDRASIAEMDKTRNDLMQELRQISGQIDRSRERLGRSRNEREANAAERELDELRKLQRDRDEEVRKLVGLADEARLSVQASEQRIVELNSRLEGSLEGATKSIASLEGSLADARGRRDKVVAKLPNRLYRRYESILSRGRVPVAKTYDGTCRGCYVQLPPMLFHQLLSRTEFGECPNCHRILYYVSPEQAAAEAEAKAAGRAGSDAAADGGGDGAPANGTSSEASSN
jgi:predicted  nucleic acid-binding Zn-ribbon protein